MVPRATVAIADGRKPRMTDPNGWEEIAYVYDPAGRRIEKKVDGATQVKYVYDGDSCIAEYDGSDTLLRKYIHGPCIDEPICMIEVADANALSYYHFDALGSVIALSDDSGNTEQVYEYSVYGQVAASDPNHANRFLFTGREFDADTGLYYYRARYYNPYIGRFLQTDPIGYGDGMNWYTYCQNGPVSRTDASGMKVEYRVERFYDPEDPTRGGILTYIPGYEEPMYSRSWEDWVEDMAKKSRTGFSPDHLSPGEDDVGWKLADLDDSHVTFWAVRALIAMGVFSEGEVQAIEKDGVAEDPETGGTKILKHDSCWVISDRMRFPALGYSAAQRAQPLISWSWGNFQSTDEEREKNTWIYGLSPIAALAHEMMHALDHAMGTMPADEKAGEARAITIQDRTVNTMYQWNPQEYQKTWDFIREYVPSFSPFRGGGAPVGPPGAR